MDYQQTLEYLYSALPMYQRVGTVAYKKDLGNTIAFCEALDNPYQKFRSIHVAGTNGKGSSSHMLAAILQCAGYNVGLYTSPHLKSFTERIKINGKEIEKQSVIDFVQANKQQIERIKPSFFETTVVMAFDFFAKTKVDIAVVETGLGGRLDSTNVITPLVSLITNIGYDHQHMLGDTLEVIAKEKAGIVKPNVPLVVSERQGGVDVVFEGVAKNNDTTVAFASDNSIKETYQLDLKGDYQQRNVPGVLEVINQLNFQGFNVSSQAINKGLKSTINLTGLKGRWQILSEKPLTICDVAHNVEGVTLILNQVKQLKFNKLYIVWGMVNDKDIDELLKLLPKYANYYFCEANVPRALSAEKLFLEANRIGLTGVIQKDVNRAISMAQSNATVDDVIYIGGSTFVVAEIENL